MLGDLEPHTPPFGVRCDHLTRPVEGFFAREAVCLQAFLYGFEHALELVGIGRDVLDARVEEVLLLLGQRACVGAPDSEAVRDDARVCLDGIHEGKIACPSVLIASFR